ncbi:hypothetical protein OA92_10015 [Marinomonas sp. SBI22]|uniref:hypothetical protein n=1 Tax=unclassified Marinomonas TaxID=196814 RepID=UPI0007AF05D1|nr:MULTISPECIES: hypothetical protein [unclassified Marinomonas]KZM43086.1 hypothetical protein OA92_10015 [Marinomonas sp. SBI22]KZM44657.1 hypothetical protein OA91_09440 [Marinomonas sp. SBI8L]
MGKGNSSNSTTNNTTNYNLQGVQGQAVIAGNGNTVTTTDHGAVQAGLTVASQAITSNQAVNLASMDHVVSMAKDANLSIQNTAKYAVDEVGSAWSSSSKMAVEEANSAAALVVRESAANADRVERMAAAVSTNGQNLMAENNLKVLYVVGGVSAAAVVGFAFLARSKK